MATATTEMAGPGAPAPPDGHSPFGNGPIDLPDLPHAWSTPTLWVWDTLRIGIVLLSLYVIYLCAFTAVVSRSAPQRAITASYMFAVMLSTWTQIERIGRPLSWRFIPAALMAGFGLWGLIHYLAGGYRVRDLSIRSWLVPPPPNPFPTAPADIAQRLRPPRDRR